MYCTFILFLLALLSLSAPAWASVIYVSGAQTGTWSADTVLVTAEVRVPPGQSLTIEPGVEVLFQGYYKFIVNHSAILVAVGTLNDSIRFDVFTPGRHWHGIRFLSASDSSRLEYCHITHGLASGSVGDCDGGAIYCNNSSPTVQYCLIDSCSSYEPSQSEGGGGICCFRSNPNIIGNTISANSSGDRGGGIFCTNHSNPSISGNTISGNSLAGSGGGISCEIYSSPSISGNIISANSSGSAGGIHCADNSNPSIIGNTISANSSEGSAGGVSCSYDSNPSIIGNTISGNSSSNYGGGGIYCGGPTTVISGNTISGNSATSGGGIYCGFISNPSISGNILSGNSANNGGGIYCYHSNPTMNKNSIVSNEAAQGGGIYCQSSNPTLVNCILWGNTPEQIYQTSGSNVQATYSDIAFDPVWPGTGNINAWPAFVDTALGDYHLLWGSPCIDSGDPDPICNDPDFTRADMGCYYYDQGLPNPVSLTLTPLNPPIQIPASGGTFNCIISVANSGSTGQSVTCLCDVTLPGGSIFGPVLGPVILTMTPGFSISPERTQVVPARAPAGVYSYNAHAIVLGDTVSDSFPFEKLGAAGSGLFSSWDNWGDDFTEMSSQATSNLVHRSTFILHPCSPNPFNPTTALSYQLSAGSHVNLKVYDTAGRLVAELVNGWRDAGAHQITYDGSGLPSGIYFAKLRAGDYSQVQKLVLMK